MKKEIDQELLIRYINDRCTPEDLLRVQEFLKDPEWQRGLENMLEADFYAMEHEKPDEKNLEEWIQQFRGRYFKKPRVKLWYEQWIGYAAACLIVLGISGYFLNKATPDVNHMGATSLAMIEKNNPRGVRSKIILQDSSVVYLGAGSSIRFPERFAEKERIVMLTGEAFFEVSKNPERPFIIQTGEIKTTVLGTSFKIIAFKGNPLSVEVATGKVRVSKMGSRKGIPELAVLTPGEGIIWDGKSGQATAIHTDITVVKGWVAGEIAFKNRSMAQIAAELENWYDVEITFAKSAPVGKRLSLSIDGTGSLSAALDVICNTAHLSYHFNGRQEVTISGNN